MFDRWYAATLQEKLGRPYVHLIFGARQTGKSTLLRSLLPPETLVMDLADPQERTRHLLTFMDEHPKLAKQAYIVCRCPRPMQLHEKVTALPWFCL
jgi:predicted AAA+ superfamily ATPase